MVQAERQGWDDLGEAERVYLLARACDIAVLGAEVADQTWPQPGFAGLSYRQIGDVVSLLASLLTDVRDELRGKGGQAQLGTEYSAELVPVPEYIPPQVLSAGDAQTVRAGCRNELGQADARTGQVAATIDEFAVFCDLLSKPENHSKVKTGQYRCVVWGCFQSNRKRRKMG